MKYTIYDKNTGQITKVVDCQDISIQLSENESYEEGSFQDDKYYWNNGFVEIPEKPSEFHKFDLSTKTWVEIPNAKENNIRSTRNRLLVESDWTQLPDSPLSTEKKAEWAIYRQALRDITNQDINMVIFPEKP